MKVIRYYLEVKYKDGSIKYYVKGRFGKEVYSEDQKDAYLFQYKGAADERASLCAKNKGVHTVTIKEILGSMDELYPKNKKKDTL